MNINQNRVNVFAERVQFQQAIERFGYAVDRRHKQAAEHLGEQQFSAGGFNYLPASAGEIFGIV